MLKYERPLSKDLSKKNEKKESREELHWEHGSAIECGAYHQERGKENEDALAMIGNNIRVCGDGVGGHENGKLAVETTLRALKEILEPFGSRDDIPSEEAEIHAARALHHANEEVKKLPAETKDNPQASVSIIWKTKQGREMVIGSVGNCQVFLNRDGKVEPQFIEDKRGLHIDNRFNERSDIRKIQQGIFSARSYEELEAFLGKDDARFIDKSPEASYMTQLVGNKHRDFSPNIRTVSAQEGDRIIMCSDGVSSVTSGLNEQEWLEILKHNPDAQSAARVAIRAVDNVKGWRDPEGDDRSLFIIDVKAASAREQAPTYQQSRSGGVRSKSPDEQAHWNEIIPASFADLDETIARQLWATEEGKLIDKQTLRENMDIIRRCSSAELDAFLKNVPEIIRSDKRQSIHLRRALTQMKLGEHFNRSDRQSSKKEGSEKRPTQAPPQESSGLLKKAWGWLKEFGNPQATKANIFEAKAKELKSITTFDELIQALDLSNGLYGKWISESDKTAYDVQKLREAVMRYQNHPDEIVLPRSIFAFVEEKKVSLNLRELAAKLLTSQYK
ncbi:MAG: protein phosphatase 2C domain-containing protein [Candidatus Moranbacteria bacterium]|nr:protein phosphatase 2C domain-containing protein [Candidatus Moranbacteria bacterium]